MAPPGPARGLSELAAHAVSVDDSDGFARLLGDAVGSRPIVLLGESHHGVHETYVVRDAVLGSLGRLGWRTLLAEIAHADGVHLDRYLADGDPSHLDRVGTFGCRVAATREPEGILAAQLARVPFAGYRHEMVRTLDALRAGAGRHRWRHVGFDVDYDPALAQSLLDIDGLAAHPGVASTLDASHHYDAAVRAATTWDALRDAMALREQVMAAHAIDAVRAVPDHRVVVCGHAFHLTPSPPRIELDGGIGPGGGRVPPVGAAIAAAFPGETACVWLLHDHGREAGGAADGVVRSVPGSLNAALAAAGDRFAVRTADVPELCRPWTIATVHGATLVGVPAELCDVLVFVAETTELHAG